MKLKLFIIREDENDQEAKQMDCTRYHMECSDSGYQHRMMVSNHVLRSPDGNEYEKYAIKSMADAIGREIRRDAIESMTETKLTFSEYYSKQRGNV